LPASAPGPAPDKGKVFERLTQLYLKTHPEYQTRLRKVWRVKDELPPTVRSRIGLPRTDEGIDLVAETFDGDLWAIQCKFRTQIRQPLTVTDLATFANLSFNVCRDITLAVVAHTCAKPVRKSALLPRTTEIGLARWLELDADDWRRIIAATTKSPPAPKPRAPRPHQQRAIAAARTHFLDGGASRGRLIMPCGTGKSLTAFWIAEALKARSILVTVPSLSLIKQSLSDWTREFLAHGEVPDWLCVCSDESTGRLERDEFVGGVYELGVDATTDTKAIGKFLAHKTRKRKVVFATYQSGKSLAAAARAAGFAFDLAIMDEAHRTAGSPDKSFGHLLGDENIAVVRRLFMTATERIVRGADDTVFSMDDPTVYGECFHQLSFKEAIAARPPIISDYKVLTITVSDEQVRELIAENRYLRTADAGLGEREAQALAAGIALQRAFREEGVRHAISFHRSIRAAEDFRQQQERIEAGRWRVSRPECFHISSKKTAGERADLLREFRDSPSALITNARCLQEGVDIPAVDCVLFADPKQSVVDIVQAAGRAMRPSPGKRYGYIVLPIVVPAGMEFAEFAETTEFKQVARVITALSTQDDRIAEEFRGVTAKGRRGGERIVEIVGEVPTAQRIDLAAFRDQVRLKLWERLGRANWRPFEEARSWARSLGLESYAGWRAFCKSGKLPVDIPTNPYQTYAQRGWKGWGDWLGTGTVAPRLRQYRPFPKARSWARSLGLKSGAEWEALYRSGKLPEDMPATPYQTYAGRGWKSWGDWLGTGKVAWMLKKYRSFPAARSWARSLGLQSRAQWEALYKSGKLPDDIPATPGNTYAQRGWKGMGDWLGTGRVAWKLKKYRSFSAARSWARSLGLQSRAGWIALCKSGKLPKDIPASPDQAHAQRGWKSWGDWLGTGTVAPRFRQYRSFPRARSWARSLGLKSGAEWQAFCKSGKLPSDIPASPNNTYAQRGWKGMGDWLGTGTVAVQLRRYRSFPRARSWARSLGLQSGAEWQAFCKSGKLPEDIPATPRQTYAGRGWKSMGDWLGTGTIAVQLRQYRPFPRARSWARSLGLESHTGWVAFCKSGKLPKDIPSNSNTVYAGRGWKSWGDWLGTGTVAPRLRQYRSFPEARSWARSLGLQSRAGWGAFCKSGKLPSDIPASPERTYAEHGWKGMGDWLGTGTIAPRLRQYRAFPKARSWVRALRLHSQSEWKALCRSGKLPKDMPANPDRTYSQRGWKSWGDWLGNGRVARSRTRKPG